MNSSEASSETNDEIDLRDLALMLVDGWRWILGAMVVAVMAGAVYLWTAPYSTSFRAIPASSANFSAFNLLEGLSIGPVEAIYALDNRLSSLQNYRSFVKSHKDQFEFGEIEDAIEQNPVKVSGLDENIEEALADSLAITVSYTYPKNQQGAEILNTYMEYTAKQVWESLESRFSRYNNTQVTNLETQLVLEKESLRAAREEKLFHLEQAIVVARKVGIDKPTTPQQFGQQSTGNEVIYANFNNDGALPLYFMGYEALEADRDALREVVDQGLSNETIRDTEQQLAKRQRIASLIESRGIYGLENGEEPSYTERLVSVVEYALPATGPSKPILIVLVLSVIAGGVLGIVIVFVWSLLKNLLAYRKVKAAG